MWTYAIENDTLVNDVFSKFIMEDLMYLSKIINRKVFYASFHQI